MSKSRCAVILGVLLALGSAAALWAADATEPAAPAAAPAGDSAVDARADYQSARELFNQKKYAEAGAEVDKALALDPNLHDAQLLRELIDRALQENGTGGALGARTLLTKDEINRIKLYEISDADLKKVTGSIPRKTLEEFWNTVVLQAPDVSAKSQQDHDAFVNPANLGGQIDMIERLQAEKYYDQIKISSEPQDMAAFRITVQPFVIANCGKCHSGRNNHGFPLLTGGNDPAAVAYTNFYIMSSLTYGDNKMIDRANPDKSLFIQYAIDPRNAQIIHPGDVKVGRFAGLSDPTALKLVNWVKALRFPAPNYGIDFPIPSQPAPAAPANATVPATAP